MLKSTVNSLRVIDCEHDLANTNESYRKCRRTWQEETENSPTYIATNQSV